MKTFQQALRERRNQFRYFFDNSLSVRGAFSLWIGLAIVVAAAVIAAIQAILSSIPIINQEVADPQSAFEAFWFTLGKALSLGSATTVADRLMAIIYWFVGLTVMGSIFAFRTVALNNTMERLKAAPSPILDRGHTLILGWSPRIFTILNELAIANQNVSRPLVVVFANVDRALMDKEIEARCGDLGKLRVITRKGDTTNPSDLKRANVVGAKSVIVLDSDRAGDAMVISTVLAAKSFTKDSGQRLVAEMDDKNVADALTSATNGEVVAVIPRDIIARVTAQASRQPGIPAVILELLDFDGDEIYFQEVPDLVGKNYFQAQQGFKNASLIGLVPSGGLPILNPAWNHKISQGDKVMAIAKDDDQVLFSANAEAPKRPKSKALAKQVRPAKSMLVVGWSNLGREVLNALAAYLPKGSSADIVLQKRFAELNMNWDNKFGALKTRFVEADGTFDQLRELVLTRKYDEVLVLGYRGEEISEAEADGQTLLATMQLTRLFENEMYRGSAPRLVAEILDPLKVGLAKTASIDDVVVSENLAALLIAQLSENPLLANTFADLFDPSKGSAVQVQPFSNYVKLGEEVSFAELVAMASSHGESAIGWRASASQGEPRKVVINPGKDQLIKPIEGDGLIVIGPSI